MKPFPIGVANSISANFQFDPIDTIDFARQGDFEIIQVYLNDALLGNQEVLKQLLKAQENFQQVYFHAEGMLNRAFFESDYYRKLCRFLEQVAEPKYIIHFDEHAHIDEMIDLVEKLNKGGRQIYVENYFQRRGKEDAEKNIKKFQALFTLTNSLGHTIYPVLDIPRLFHRDLEFSQAESLEWCYKLLNFFGNRRIPILLHLIDASDDGHDRLSFAALGEGYIPYDDIFGFIAKTAPLIAGVIFEFEDKINPLQSRKFIGAKMKKM